MASDATFFSSRLERVEREGFGLGEYQYKPTFVGPKHLTELSTLLSIHAWAIWMTERAFVYQQLFQESEEPEDIFQLWFSVGFNPNDDHESGPYFLIGARELEDAIECLRDLAVDFTDNNVFGEATIAFCPDGDLDVYSTNLLIALD